MDTGNKDILCCIFNHNRNENTKNWLDRFVSAGLDVYILDSGSDEPIEDEHLLEFGKVYYGGLYSKAIEITLREGYRWLFFVCDDILIDDENFDKLVKSMKEVTGSDNIGLYQPSTTEESHNVWAINKNKGTDSLRSTPILEGWAGLVNASVFRAMSEKNYDIANNNKYGWGLDILTSYHSLKQNLLNVVDDRVVVVHPSDPPTYDGSGANTMMKAFFESFGTSYSELVTECKSMIKRNVVNFKRKSDGKKQYDYVIVGSGLFGCTFANLAHKNGKRVLIVEKRGELGGNICTENVEGINVHKYGPHIFHTSDKRIWDYVNEFAVFNNYVHNAIAETDNNEIYNLPFNMNTFHQIWNDVVTPEDAKRRIDNDKERYDTIENLEQQAISMVGKTIYEKLIRHYTEKQWGRKCAQLPAETIKRLPLRFSYNNNYFNDKYQGVPVGGYSNMVLHMLNGIDYAINIDYFDHIDYLKSIADKIVYTGPIDRFFDYRFGKLEYRTVRWETRTIDSPSYQGTSVINHTGKNVQATRTIEHKYFECITEDEVNSNGKTIVSDEYSDEWDETKEPFYPINDEKNREMYAKYKELADKEDNVIFGGRLAEYKYYDMAPVIEAAMKCWEEESDGKE